MFMNEREKPINLRVMRAMNRRMDLDFEGEEEFDPNLNIVTLGLNYKVKAYTVFIGKEFTLYNALKKCLFC